MRTHRVAATALFAALLLSSAARAQDAPPAPSPPPAAPAPPQESPQAGEDGIVRDFYFQSDELVRNRDGTITWFYRTNYVGASALRKSIDGIGIPNVKTALRERDSFAVNWDDKDRRSKWEAPKRTAAPDENVLILTFPAAYKDILEEFLERFDVPEPQVYIQAKVVEVTLDSNLEYGTSIFFDKSKATATNPATFFRAARTSFRPASFSMPFLSEGNTGLGISFSDVGMDEGQLSLHIEALQERGAANILSQPAIMATQGQLATLVTGQETPVAEIKISGVSETIATVFKETGIRLDFVPLHIGREYVKLRVRPEVSSITSFLEVKGPSTTVQNPVIAQRNAETVVTIRDGMTLVIGGLYSLSEVESRTGVPILGDIPVLNFLFSRRKKTKVKSELDFFITPYILQHRLDKTVFTPPKERDRLRHAKSRRDSGPPAK
jgi:type II secretory pathway component GspD/PulD (secretin)